MNLKTVTYILLIFCLFSCNHDDNRDSKIPIEISNIVEVRVESDNAEISWKTSIEGTSSFYYGTTQSCSNEAAPTTSNNKDFSVTINSLAANQKYYYRIAAASNQDSSVTDESDIRNFTTPLYLGDIIISGITKTDITPHDITISFSTNQDSDCTIEYGPTVSYGISETVVSADGLSHTVTLHGLDELSTFNYRIWAKSNVAGWDSVYSSNDTFSTIDLYEVTITNVQVVLEEGTDYVEISWETKDYNGTDGLYAKRNLYVTEIKPYGEPFYSPPFSMQSHTVLILCDPNVTYFFQIEAIPYDLNDDEYAPCASNIEACYKNTFYESTFINDNL